MLVAGAHAAELKETADLVENFATREISDPRARQCGDDLPPLGNAYDDQQGVVLTGVVKVSDGSRTGDRRSQRWWVTLELIIQDKCVACARRAPTTARTCCLYSLPHSPLPTRPANDNLCQEWYDRRSSQRLCSCCH